MYDYTELKCIYAKYVYLYFCYKQLDLTIKTEIIWLFSTHFLEDITPRIILISG